MTLLNIIVQHGGARVQVATDIEEEVLANTKGVLVQLRTSKAHLFCSTQILTPEMIRNTSKMLNTMFR